MKNKGKLLVMSAIALFGMTGSLVTIDQQTCISEVAAENVYTATFTKLTSGTNYSAYDKSHTFTSNSISWTITGNQSVGDFVRVGGKSLSNVDREFVSTTKITSAVSKITVNHAGRSKDNFTLNSVKVYSSTTSGSFSNVGVTVTPSYQSAGSFDLVPETPFPANSFYKIVFNITISTSNNSGLDIQSFAFEKAVAEKTPSKIELQNAKTNYYEGDSVTMPTVKVIYTDNTNADVTSKATIKNFDASTTGVHHATIEYTENNTTVSADYEYTVNADTLNSITLGGSVTGKKGQAWDLSGVTLTGSFASGTKTITGFNPTTSTPVPTATGTYDVIVSVSYGGQSTSKTYSVTIAATGETEDDPISVTQAMSIADDASNSNITKLYYVLGVLTGDPYNTTYGNFYINDDGNNNNAKLTVYGITASQTALSYSGGKWSFTNPKDFASNDATKGLKAGDKVLLKLRLYKYSGTLEGDGLFIKLVANDHTVTTNLTNATFDKTGTQNFDSAFSGTITASTGYNLPATLTVTLGGNAFNNYSYNNTTGVFSIAAGVVGENAGDLVITGNATKKTYTITNNLTGVTSSNTTTSIEYGSSFETTLSASEHHKVVGVTVTMGGVAQSSAYDVSTGKVSIANVTGNIVITASSEEYAVTGVTLDQEDCMLSAGGSISVEATVSPTELANRSVSWSDVPDGLEVGTDYTLSIVDNVITLRFDGETKKSGSVTLTATAQGNGGAGHSASITITLSNYELTDVAVTGTPVATQYTGHAFDATNLSFAEVYNNGDKTNPNAKAITASDITWNPLVAGQAPTGIYTHDGYAPVTVTVLGVTVVENVLESIAIEGDFENKSYFSNAAEFNLAGLTVSGLMTSGDAATINPADVEWSTSANPADLVGENQTLTVTATYGGKTATKDITGITVTERKITKLEVTTQPMTSYILGDEFDSTGLVVKATYNDGTHDDNFTGYTLDTSAINKFAEGTYEVHVELEGALSASFNVKYDKLVPQDAVEQYNKVTSEPTSWVGDYLLVYEGDDTVVWTGLDGASERVSAVATSGVISTKPDTASIIRIAEMEGGYSIQVVGGTNNGKYIGQSGYTNGMSFNDSQLLNTISFSSDHVVITASGGCELRFNNGTNATADQRFRYYKSGQQPVQLYKLFKQEAVTASLIGLEATTTKTFKEGDTLSISDLTVQGIYNSADKKTITSGVTFVGGGTTKTLAAGPNTFEVQYSDGTSTFTTSVTVNATALVKVSSITVTSEEGKTSIYEGQSLQMSASILPENADNKEFEWSCTGDAEISEEGLVTAKSVTGNGSATIVATAKDGSNVSSEEFVLTIKDDSVTGIVLAETNAMKTTYSFGDEFDPSGLVIEEVYESGKHGDPITYDAATFALGIETGTELNHTVDSCTVTYGGHSLTTPIAITVNRVPVGLEVTDFYRSVVEGCEYEIGPGYTATVTYSDGKNPTTTTLDSYTVNTSTHGDATVTAKATVDGVELTGTFTINVEKDTVTKLELINGLNPDELVFDHNSSFSAEGKLFRATFKSGETSEFGLDDSHISVSPATFTEAGENKSVTITYTDDYSETASLTINGIKVNAVPVSAEIVGTPVIQKNGEAYSGIICQHDRITVLADVKVTYSDSEEHTETIPTLISINTDNPGSSTGTAYVSGLPVTYTVSGITAVSLDHIEVTTSGVKTDYYAGENFNQNGVVVTAYYNNETSKVVTDNATIIGKQNLTPETEYLVVSYTEGGIEKTTKIYINVVAKTITSLEVTSDACKVYIPGETFDPTGLTLKATYNDGTFVEGIASTGDKTFSYTVEGNVVHITWSDGTLSKSLDYNITNKTLQDISGITVNVDDAFKTATVGDTYTFSGEVVASFAGTDKTLVLEPGQYSVSSINTTTPGTKIITVTANGKTASYNVVVNYAPVGSVAISGNTGGTFAIGDTTQLTATVNPDNANNAVSWSSSDNDIATVNNGLVTFKREGTVTITATSIQDPNMKGTVTLTCEQVIVHPTNVTLNESSKTLDIGGTFQLVATVTPTDAANKTVTFTSSDTTIVTVDVSTGLVTAVKDGIAIIEVQTDDGNLIAQCTITVNAPVQPTPDNGGSQGGKKLGCFGSIAATSALVSLATLAGAGLALSKKRKKEDK